MQQKNPPEFYDLEYMQGVKLRWAGGATRWEDNGTFLHAALFARDCAVNEGIENPSFLDVGCGRGWVVQHLRNLGCRAQGCEYGVAARENSVLDDVRFGDLADRLPYDDNEFDFVSCVGVLSHLPEEFTAHAVKELARVSRRFVWTNILTIPPGRTLADLPRIKLEQAHHLTVRHREDWLEDFSKARLVDATDTALLDFYFGTKDWAQWHSVWTKGAL